jgi:hypothetical protein
MSRYPNHYELWVLENGTQVPRLISASPVDQGPKERIDEAERRFLNDEHIERVWVKDGEGAVIWEDIPGDPVQQLEALVAGGSHESAPLKGDRG